MGEISQYVKVNGVRVKALIDSGATDNYLSIRIAKRIHLYNEGKQHFTIADGKKLQGWKGYINIDAFKRTGSTSVIVTKILPKEGYDIILGQTFLQDNEVDLDFSKDAMKYGKHQPKIRKIGRLL